MGKHHSKHCVIFATDRSYVHKQSLIRSEPPHPPEAFPDAALVAELVDGYFVHFNVYFPLLHRPTFEAGIRDGLHLRNEGFGSTVLLVCAIGARFSDDTRVLPPETRSWHWAGWVWFQRVSSARKLVHLSSPCVYDLQICVVKYLRCAEAGLD